MLSDIRQKEYAVDGHIVRYWVRRCEPSDERRPWLVFLPGLTADHTLFDDQMAYFADKANCLVWDAPAHGLSRPFPLTFTMADYAETLFEILQTEQAVNIVLVGQSFGGYVSQAYIEAYPGTVAGFISIDSSTLKRKYYPNWEVAFLRHTKGMYLSIPWGLLKWWGCIGVATSQRAREQMRVFMDSYTKREYCELAAYGYRVLADALDDDRPYDIDCPVLLLCGEKDHAGDVKPFNRAWSKGEGIPLVWVPGAGHNSNVDAPDFVNAQIEKFLGSLGFGEQHADCA